MNDHRPSFVASRRYTTGFSVLVSVLSLLAIVVMANYLAATRFVWRRDVAAQGTPPLSPLTMQTLAGLTNAVHVTVLFDPESGLFPHVDALLREYTALQPLIQVRLVDYFRNPSDAELAKVRYRLGATANDLVVFDAGDRQRVVTAAEMSIYHDDDVKNLMAGVDTDIRRSGFRGEQLFTSALAALAEGAASKAYYLQGHGEHPPDSEERSFGYAKFLRLLVHERNLTVEPLRLAAATNEIPADCQLLVIAGPTGPLFPGEVRKLDAYLQRGGRMLVLLHPYAVSTNSAADRPLERLLQDWAIAAPSAYAGDEQFTLTKVDVLTTSFGTHSLVAPLRRGEGSLYFPLPRIVAPLPENALPADAPKAEVLVSTSESGFTRSDVANANAGFLPGRDQRGLALPLAVAAEKGGVAGVSASRGTTRLVVVGDSTMFGNETLEKAKNRDFAGLLVSWLLDRQQALAIGPKPIHEYRLLLTAAQLRTIRWTLLGALPGGVLALGFVVWLRRRA